MPGKKGGAKPAVVTSVPVTNADGSQTAPKRSDECCVFVGNVAFTTTWQKLKDVMRKAGDVQLVELVVDASHKPKGSALVTFGQPEDAQKAVGTLNGVQLDGRELLVRPYEKGARPLVIYGNYTREQLNRVLPKDKQTVPAAAAPAHHQQQLQQPMQQHHQHPHQHQNGKAMPPLAHQQQHQQQQQQLMQDRVSLRAPHGGAAAPAAQGGKHEFRVFDGGDFNKRNRDTFGDEAVAYRPNGNGVPTAEGPQGHPVAPVAPMAHHQHHHHGGPMAEQRRKLFVSNLPFTCTWKLLKDTFAQVGKVVRADIIMDDRGRSRGMGTVVFATYDEAVKAIEEFDGIEMEGRPMGVRLDRDFIGA